MKRGSPLLGAALVLGCTGLSVAGAAELRKATLQPTYTLDLESGRTGGLGDAQDLFWQARTRSERCLGPSYKSRALLAPLAARDYGQADAAKLAGLVYSSRCLSHSDSGGEIEKGLTFAVRTTEGNFAKVKVAGITSGNKLELEWTVFPAAGASTAAPNPSLSIRELLEQALKLLRAQKPAAAVPLLQQAVAGAGELPAGARRAEALTEAGSMLWSANRRDLAEPALLAATREMEGRPASAVPADLRGRAYRMLGVVYRDQNKSAEAVPWFQRAVDVDKARPETSPQLAGEKYFSMASNLRELAAAQCRAGEPSVAETTDRQRLDACGRSRNPQTIGSCRDEQRACKEGWMKDGSKRQYGSLKQ